MALLDGLTGSQPQTNGGEPLYTEVVELNVGGQIYVTRRSTLTSVPHSVLWRSFSAAGATTGAAAGPTVAATSGATADVVRDARGRYFIDRDGFLFRYVLDFLRDQQLVLPDHFPERARLRREAEFFQLPELVKALTPRPAKASSLNSEGSEVSEAPGRETASPGYITLACRGHYSFPGREGGGGGGGVDGRFRRAARISACGRSALVRAVFGDALLERSREVERGPPGRYSSRLTLAHASPEQAFDALAEAGFSLVASHGSGVSGQPSGHNEDKVWSSYTEFVFFRGSSSAPAARRRDAPLAPRRRVEVERDADGAEEKDSDSGSTEEGSTSSCDSQSEGHASPLPAPPHAANPSRPETLTLQRPARREGGREGKGLGGGAGGPGCGGAGGGGGGGGGGKKRRNSDRPETLTDALGVDGSAGIGANEMDALAEQLHKCVADVRRLRIPKRFSVKTRAWQADLLHKHGV
ncbi:BTB/POZ domain-containing protein KCTD12 [Petromyzon marinus]|uniref:BTB/POZ domain-containing protein KCTD12-like n=1 Tax=Petromyzon marinus TaxID=7757 RepID=A0AAJ7WVQ0_PETMA|nr:BTB/POZ domain-containing protein KCTD12-like [Petromyzon marinus]